MVYNATDWLRYFVDKKAKGADDNYTASAKFYIAAEEVDWDYTPLGVDGCTGEQFGPEEQVFTAAGNFLSGSRYVKAVYREYEDEDFTSAKAVDTNLTGINGPLLHFEAGETVEIVFKNMVSFPCNLHILGLTLVGSTLGTSEVLPGMQTTYVFRVAANVSPSKHDLSSVPYVYYSSVDPIAHTAAGLVGVVAVTRKGQLDFKTRLPKHVSRTVPWLMNVFRENQSPLIMKSLRKFGQNLEPVTKEKLEELSEDEEWIESNAMHSVNGFLYGSTLRNGEFEYKEIVRFYVFGFGSEESSHGPAWIGQSVHGRSLRGNFASGIQILPFNAGAVDVFMSSNGTWPFVCEVEDHVLAGMKLCFNVT